jgi:hypothetical protein
VTKPQQPELARSGRSEADPAAVKTRHGGPTDSTAPVGTIPEDNLPGHHPVHDQDKPEGPPPRPRARRRQRADVIDLRDERSPGDASARDGDAAPNRTNWTEHFGFPFDARLRPAALAFGITERSASLDIADGELRVRFGPWSLRTPLDNVVGAEVTGPYAWWRVAGPARLSFGDRGLTFATNAERGVCIRFKEPVSGLVPGGLLKHPNLTVTVDEPERLVQVLAGSSTAAVGT